MKQQTKLRDEVERTKRAKIDCERILGEKQRALRLLNTGLRQLDGKIAKEVGPLHTFLCLGWWWMN